MKRLAKETGKKPYIGVMASDSNGRKNDLIKHSCNAFGKKDQQSRPLSHWHTEDVWDYIAAFNVPYCEAIYKDMGYKRTGCMWCAFGAQFETEEDNRFIKLSQTHPKIYKHCIEGLGLGKVLDFIGVAYKKNVQGDFLNE